MMIITPAQHGVRHCAYCGDPLPHRRRKYCSDPCQQAGWKAEQRHKRALARRRRCAGCNTPFTPTRADGLYCTDACRQRAYRLRVTGNDSSNVAQGDSRNGPGVTP